MKPCVFCEQPEIQARIILKNNLVFAFLTNIPITPGHTLVAPVRCVSAFDDLTRGEIRALFLMRKRIVNVLKRSFCAEGFHFVWNEGKVAGQSVPHFHLHIVPRKKGDTGITEYEPRKFLYRSGSRESSPEKELQAVAQYIKMSLK
jgi:histidine triad (HIT) family protein